MSLNAKSDLSLLPLLPTNESPQEPSLAANGLTSVLSEHKIAKIRAKHDSRGCGRALTNGKHEQFASLIALGQNPASAYSSCGYSSKGAGQSANRLLQKPEVSARVKELKVAVSERQVEKTLVNRAWLMQTLRQIVDRAMQFEPERDCHGNPSGQYKYDPATAIKAVELMGRELGVFQKNQVRCHSPRPRRGSAKPATDWRQRRRRRWSKDSIGRRPRRLRSPRRRSNSSSSSSNKGRGKDPG